MGINALIYFLFSMIFLVCVVTTKLYNTTVYFFYSKVCRRKKITVFCLRISGRVAGQHLNVLYIYIYIIMIYYVSDTIKQYREIKKIK